MSPQPLVLMVEQVPEVMRSSLVSAETVKGLRPLRGSRGELLTAASLRLGGSQEEWPAIPLTGTREEHGQSAVQSVTRYVSADPHHRSVSSVVSAPKTRSARQRPRSPESFRRRSPRAAWCPAYGWPPLRRARLSRPYHDGQAARFRQSQSAAAPAVAFTTVPVSMRARSDRQVRRRSQCRTRSLKF